MESSVKIVTITGASGAGKSTLASYFLNRESDSRLITSYTSRSLRDTDLPGEYECNVSAEEFEQRRDEYVWIKGKHGNIYGTTKKSVIDAIQSPLGPCLMLLIPECVELLRDYLSQFENFETLIKSFYLLSPGEQELRRRLQKRGETEESIQERIIECSQWDSAALKSQIPYIFIKNDEKPMGIHREVEQIVKALR